MNDVRNFGAVGDGVADDTDAIQHAVDMAGGSLLLSPGTYRIERTIEVRLSEAGPAAISGSGGAATLVMHGEGPALRLTGTHGGTADPGTITPEVQITERMPTVTGLVIRGAAENTDGIELIGTMHAVIDRVAVNGCRHAIRLHERNRNLIVRGCQLYHNRGVGVYFDAVNLHQVNIIGSHISYNRLGGIRVERSEVRNLQITGCDIEYNNHRSHGTEPEPTAEIWIDTTTEGASVNEVAICSNTIQATASPEGANIRILEQVDESRPPGLFTITGNVIGSQAVNVHLTGCYGITLSGNTIYSGERRNILIEDCRLITLSGNVSRRHTDRFHTGWRLERSRDCVISGCQIHDEAPEGQGTGASLLEIDRCDRITISGCQFIDGAPFGIDVSDSNGIVIAATTIAETRADPVAQGAARFRGLGDGNRLTALSVSGEFAGDALQFESKAGVSTD